MVQLIFLKPGSMPGFFMDANLESWTSRFISCFPMNLTVHAANARLATGCRFLWTY